MRAAIERDTILVGWDGTAGVTIQVLVLVSLRHQTLRLGWGGCPRDTLLL